jgi:hypothetical protein
MSRVGCGMLSYGTSLCLDEAEHRPLTRRSSLTGVDPTPFHTLFGLHSLVPRSGRHLRSRPHISLTTSETRQKILRPCTLLSAARAPLLCQAEICREKAASTCPPAMYVYTLNPFRHYDNQFPQSIFFAICPRYRRQRGIFYAYEMTHIESTAPTAMFNSCSPLHLFPYVIRTRDGRDSEDT